MYPSATVSRAAENVENVLDEIRSLTPQIRRECLDIDNTRIVPPTIVDALRDLGVFRLLAPRQIGGGEADPLTFLRIVEEASCADGSVGWCVMIGGCYSTFAGLLPPDGAAEIYGDANTISAGAFRPSGVAHQVDGGYLVSGRWQLGSGSSHANWYLGGCAVADGDTAVLTPAGAPLLRQMFFPASEVQVIYNWDSTGLRGTASHDYSVSDVFVPRHRTLWFSDPPNIDDALYRMPVVAVFATYVGAVPLGIARHALDAFRVLAREKTQTSSGSVLADRPGIQATFGRAYTLVAAARTNLMATLTELWDRVQRGHCPTLADHASLWVAATHGAQSALEAIQMLYGAAGATSVYAACPLDRCLRDARTAVQHIVLQNVNLEYFGRDLLTPGGVPGPWILDYRGG
jgi:alkylation response protein AidB-like acyl-CoA dehydrogenase